MSFQLIAITPPYIYKGEAICITDALNERFDRVHIRKPGSSGADIAAMLAEIPEQLHCRISIHDHFELTKQFPTVGIHLNSRNPTPPDGWEGTLSRSLHSPGALSEELPKCYGNSGKTRRKFNYTFLSPIFPSLSKPGYRPAFSFEEMAKAASPEVIALGGVTFHDLQHIESAGFGGAAMLTEAWRHPIDMSAFRLQLITHPRADKNVTEGAALALAGGCRWIQLRHKDASYETLKEEATAIAQLCRQYGATFIIDDHVELTKETGADGVHLGKNDMPIAEARKILGPSYIIGATANTFSDLEKAAESGADYAGVGPYRFTTTKEKLAPTLGLEGYREIIAEKSTAAIRLPIVAIGGITPKDITALMATGADGIAVSGAILNSENPRAATENLISLLEET